MIDRATKFLLIINHVHALYTAGITETFDQLAQWLNRQGILTSYGTPYVGGRGVARLVQATYNFVRDEQGLGDVGARPIAEAFTNKHGEYAYD